MAENENEQRDRLLIVARLMFQRKEYESARQLLENLNRQFPQCSEAKSLLMKVEAEQVWLASKASAESSNVDVFRIEGRLQIITAALGGIITFLIGLYFGIDMIVTYCSKGKGGQLVLNDQGSIPVSYPIHFLILLPLLLIGLGVWFIYIAYLSWAREHR